MRFRAKKSRVERRSSSVVTIPERTLMESSQNQGFHSFNTHSSFAFNDPSNADVILRLHTEPINNSPSSSLSEFSPGDHGDLQLYLHSSVLQRSKYFATILSGRWKTNSSSVDSNNSTRLYALNLKVTSTIGSFTTYFTVLQLFYAVDFSTAFGSASDALSILSVALEILFEDCVEACVRYLKVVPWTEEEEKRVSGFVPLLRPEESEDLLARLSPAGASSEDMLYGLIVAAIPNHSNMELVKPFVAKFLRSFPVKSSVKGALDRAFQETLKLVKESLQMYLGPFRVSRSPAAPHPRVNNHTAMINAKHLQWLLEIMVELRVADSALKEWTDDDSSLLKAFQDDLSRNIPQELSASILQCICRLTNAILGGLILPSMQDRVKLIKDWLPVVIVCKDKGMPSFLSYKSLYQQLEEEFLTIVSTLSLSDALVLLPQFLSFYSQNVVDCPHMFSALNTWFRRVNRPNKDDIIDSN